jgi:hypothetical protein
VLAQQMNKILHHLQSEAGQTRQPPRLDRLRTRLALIDFMQKVALHPAVYQRLRLAQRTPDVPHWWRCGEHDQGLIYGLLVHGIGNWQRICTDPKVGIQMEYKPVTAEWIMTRVMYILRLFRRDAAEGLSLPTFNAFPNLLLSPLPAIIPAVAIEYPSLMPIPAHASTTAIASSSTPFPPATSSPSASQSAQYAMLQQQQYLRQQQHQAARFAAPQMSTMQAPQMYSHLSQHKELPKKQRGNPHQKQISEDRRRDGDLDSLRKDGELDTSLRYEVRQSESSPQLRSAAARILALTLAHTRAHACTALEVLFVYSLTSCTHQDNGARAFGVDEERGAAHSHEHSPGSSCSHIRF